MADIKILVQAVNFEQVKTELQSRPNRLHCRIALPEPNETIKPITDRLSWHPLITTENDLKPHERKYVEDQKQLFINDKKNEMPEQERPELIKILDNVFSVASCFLFIYGIPYAYSWALHFIDTNITDWFNSFMDLFKISVCVFYVFIAFGFLGEFISGEYDNWIKKNIDPYIIKLKNWLNRRNL